MDKLLFGITTEDGRLILTRRPGAAFENVMGFGMVTIVAFVAGWRFVRLPNFDDPTPLLVQFAAPLMMLIWLAIYGGMVAKFWRIFKGDHWIFDASDKTLQHGEEFVCRWEDLVRIQIVEDEEDHICHRLQLISRGSGTLVLEENAERRLDELVRVATVMADYTGLEVEHTT